MAYGTPSNPVAGTVITVAYAISNILDPIRALRANTGAADPPGVDLVSVSTAVGGPSSWRQIPTNALADLAVTVTKIADGAVNAAKLAAGVAIANIGFVPFNTAGDTVTPGQVRVLRSVGSAATLFDTAHVVTQTPNAATNNAEVAGIGFHRTNVNGLALFLGPGQWLRMMTNAGTIADFWTNQNMGSGSGLDADTLRTRAPSFTSAPYAIPVAGADGKIDAAWVPLAGVPVGLIALWNSASAAPTGWVMETAFAAKFPIGAGTGFAFANPDGGAQTHNHGLDPAHYSSAVGTASGGSARMQVSGTGTDPMASTDTHNHNFTQAIAHVLTNATANHLPPYHITNYIRKS